MSIHGGSSESCMTPHTLYLLEHHGAIVCSGHAGFVTILQHTFPLILIPTPSIPEPNPKTWNHPVRQKPSLELRISNSQAASVVWRLLSGSFLGLNEAKSKLLTGA